MCSQEPLFQPFSGESIMKRTALYSIAALAVGLVVLFSGFGAAGPKKTLRIGKVVGLKPEKMAEYKRLHTGENCVVRDLLEKYHLRNYSIFLHEIDGKWYEFAYLEYDGDDLDADMAKLSAEPRNIEWLKICDPMQIPLKGQKSWATMEPVFYNP
jgi:L-rhamnose mutarotase